MKQTILTSIFIALLVTQAIPQRAMQDYKLEGLTIAVTNMSEMLKFYENVFQIKFLEKAMYGSTLYTGKWGEMQLLFCPAEIAGNTAKQNRQQFDVRVKDVLFIARMAEQNGGRLMGEVQESNGIKSIGIYDPDGNSIVFKEYSDI